MPHAESTTYGYFRGSYLARYTHRVAITNHRLVAFEHDQVSFRWKDYAHGNKKKIMTLGSQEFLRRFLLHVLPRGFAGPIPRSRHFLPRPAHLFPLPKMFHSHAYRGKILCHNCLATLDQEHIP